MKKIILLLAAACTFVLASAEDKPYHFKPYGFIRNYAFFNSRATKSLTEDIFFFVPLDEKMVGGNDVNAVSSYNYQAITTRLGLDILGYQVGNTRINGKIEADFYGLNSTGNTGTFRMRQAYVDLLWDGRGENGTTDLSRFYGETTIETPAYDNVKLKDCARYFSLPENIGNTLAAGTHNLTVVYKEAGKDSPWRELFGPTHTIEVTVKADGTIETPIFHPCPKFSTDAASIHIDGPMLTHLPHAVSATIDNSGDEAIHPLEFLAYSITDGVLTSKEACVKTTIFSEAGTATDIIFEGASFAKAGQYVSIIALQDDKLDFSGKTLDEVTAAPAYIGHTLTTIEMLPFTCEAVEYLGQQTIHDDMPRYAISFQLTNGTTMDYNSILMAKVYSLTDKGPELINLYGVGYTMSLLNLASNTQGTSIVKFSNELQPGNYLVELQINKDFQADPSSALMSDFFAIATMPFTISTTGIRMTEDRNNKKEEVLGGWYSINGVKLNGKPTKKGIYIHQGRKISIY